jgi:hypothetical protein
MLIPSCSHPAQSFGQSKDKQLLYRSIRHLSLQPIKAKICTTSSPVAVFGFSESLEQGAYLLLVSGSHPVHFVLHALQLIFQFSIPLSQVLFPPRWWRHEGNVLNRPLRRGDELSRSGICRVGSWRTDRSKQAPGPNFGSRRRYRYSSWLLLLRSLDLRVLLVSSTGAAQRSLPISILYRFAMRN